MQLNLFPDSRAARIVEIDRRLQNRFAAQGPFLRLDPVSQLILAMLGGKTRGEVSKSAFASLVRRFGSWDAVRDASEQEIYRSISSVTFAADKARYLKAALEAITRARGRPTLDFLAEKSLDRALAWLETLPGVGRKCAAATLNFSYLHKRALVIDSHHLRILRRLGLIASRAGTAQAYDQIMPLLPPGWGAEDLDRHHGRMKALGQSFCLSGEPLCGLCPLRGLCPTGMAKRGVCLDSRPPRRAPPMAKLKQRLKPGKSTIEGRYYTEPASVQRMAGKNPQRLRRQQS